MTTAQQVDLWIALDEARRLPRRLRRAALQRVYQDAAAQPKSDRRTALLDAIDEASYQHEQSTMSGAVLVDASTARAVGNPLAHSARPTARQAEKERKKLSREIDAAARDKARAKLAELRAAVREAKKSPKVRRAEAVAQCKAAREAHRERAKALRVDARSTVSDAIQADRVALRTACAERKREITAKGASELETARRLLAEERRLVRELAALERSSRSRERARPRASAAERVAESDDRVRSHIPPDLAALFEKVKRRIFETDRESRTEAFLRYAEEHPDEVVRSQEAAADREIARLVAEQSAHEAEMAREGVPF